MLTEQQKRDYVAKKGYYCPYCGSENISAGPFDGEGCFQPVECADCGRTWQDIYELIDIEETE